MTTFNSGKWIMKSTPDKKSKLPSIYTIAKIIFLLMFFGALVVAYIFKD
jgi:hypothetical protein